jgi:hypothetical protein
MPGPDFDAREYLKVHRQQNKRLAQTREAFSGMLRALFFQGTGACSCAVLYTIYKEIVFQCVDML